MTEKVPYALEIKGEIIKKYKKLSLSKVYFPSLYLSNYTNRLISVLTPRNKLSAAI